MKRVLLILTALTMLFCFSAATEPATEPAPESSLTADARELWRASDEAMEGYDNIDMDSYASISMEVNGKSTTAVLMQRIKGTALHSASPALQMVSTGDTYEELYYANGTIYINNECGCYQAPMTPEALEDYLETDTPSLNEDCFSEVALVSSEDGYELSFSGAKEDFAQELAATLAGENAGIKDGSITAEGRLWLDANGEYLGARLDLQCTLVISSLEIPSTIKIRETLLSHDGSSQILLPDKLSYYTPVDNILTPVSLYNALQTVENAASAEYAVSTRYKGQFRGSTYSFRPKWHVWLTRDLISGDFRYYSDVILRTGVGYAYDFSPGEPLYLDHHGAVDMELTDEFTLAYLDSDLKDFTSLSLLDWIEDPSYQETETGAEISFTPARDMMLALTGYHIDQLGRTRDYVTFTNKHSYCIFSNASGLLELDENGKLKLLSVTFDFNFPILNETGATISYSKEFISINEEVVFPESYIPLWYRE